jgi:hypothetical protein
MILLSYFRNFGAGGENRIPDRLITNRPLPVHYTSICLLSAGSLMESYSYLLRFCDNIATSETVVTLGHTFLVTLN